MTTMLAAGRAPLQYEGEADVVLTALPLVLAGIEAAILPVSNTAICPDDGCLLIVGTGCPACAVRAMPRVCSCGSRIRAAADRCSRCRRRPVQRDRPFRWVSRGGIQRPVFYEVA